jgi:signal transduction histidine kinase/ActR/RegA family two-component response regulator
VLRPLSSLVDASNRVAGGDFTKKIPETETYDEMGRMVRAFNLMIDKIADNHANLQKDIQSAQGRITQTERRLFAAQRLSATGTLAAGIAHEINNPLGGMLNAARMLREGRLDPAKQQEYLELIADGLERVRTIVQKILQFRPRAFEPQPVRLQEAVEKAIAFMEHRARAKEVTLRNELPADLPVVNGDPLELQQAFLNILMNAADACVVGEGMVTIYGRATGDGVSVSVADNGCGMEPDELARCTDLFFTTKDVGEGTGLGLSICHGIITALGGQISVESAPGRGTVVRVVLPAHAGDAARDAAPAPASEAAAAANGRKRHRVMLVDDEPQIAHTMERLLRRDYDITVALCGREAIEHITRGARFDAIVSDVMMPNMTGIELSEELRRVAPDQARRLIFLSGGAFTAQARERLDELGAPQLEKPVTAKELRACVLRVVTEARPPA